MIGPPSDNLNLLCVGVARRPYIPPLPLPIGLRHTLKTLYGNGDVHQSPKGLIVPYIQFLLKERSETPEEMFPLLVIRIHLTASILSQVVKLGHILHYRPTPWRSSMNSVTFWLITPVGIKNSQKAVENSCHVAG